MKEFFIYALSVCLGVTLIFGAAMAFIYAMGTVECKSYQEATGIQTKFDGFNCYRNVQGKWMTASEYALRFATKEAQ